GVVPAGAFTATPGGVMPVRHAAVELGMVPVMLAAATAVELGAIAVALALVAISVGPAMVLRTKTVAPVRPPMTLPMPGMAVAATVKAAEGPAATAIAPGSAGATIVTALGGFAVALAIAIALGSVFLAVLLALWPAGLAL